MSPRSRNPAAAVSQKLLDSASAMLPEIRSLAQEIDDSRRLPDRLVQRLTDAGFFRMLLGNAFRRPFGGLETDPVTAAKVVQTLSTASSSVGWVVMIIASTVYWATRVLPEESVPEVFPPGPPCNVAGTLVPHGRAVKTEGGWRLTGQWPFGSGCAHADWMASGSWLHDDDGAIADDRGNPAWRIFLTPIDDCTILDTWYTTGLRGTGSHDYTMADIFVPDRLVIQHPLQAAPVRSERHYAYPAVVMPMMAAVSLGTARAAVNGLVELYESKMDRRSGRPVAASYDKQADLGAAEALVGSAEAYLYSVLSQVWAKVLNSEEVPLELRGRFRLACTNAVSASVEAVNRVHGAAGASSIYVSSDLERYFRDVHTDGAHAFMRPSSLADGALLLLGQEPAIKIF